MFVTSNMMSNKTLNKLKRLVETLDTRTLQRRTNMADLFSMLNMILNEKKLKEKITTKIFYLLNVVIFA